MGQLGVRKSRTVRVNPHLWGNEYTRRGINCIHKIRMHNILRLRFARAYILQELYNICLMLQFAHAYMLQGNT